MNDSERFISISRSHLRRTTIQETAVLSLSYRPQQNNSNVYSGVFRISVRRGRCAVGVEESRVRWRGWAPPQKKNRFRPEIDKFGCIFPLFLTVRKHESLGTLILQFNREITPLAVYVRQRSPMPNVSGLRLYFNRVPITCFWSAHLTKNFPSSVLTPRQPQRSLHSVNQNLLSVPQQLRTQKLFLLCP